MSIELFVKPNVGGVSWEEFCENIKDATFLNSKEKAYEALDKLKENDIAISGSFEIDVKDLLVLTTSIQYEII